MKRSFSLLLLLVAACGSVPVAIVPAAEPAEPVAVAPPAPEPETAPPLPDSRVVVLLTGGEPVAMVPGATIRELGAHAVAYLASCRDRERRAGSEFEWESARGAPMCLILQFEPAAEIRTAAGTTVKAGEVLVPLGITRFEGVVLARDGAPSYAALLAGDPAIFDELRTEAIGALGLTARGN